VQLSEFEASTASDKSQDHSYASKASQTVSYDQDAEALFDDDEFVIEKKPATPQAAFKVKDVPASGTSFFNIW
jgi:hypothetical protein